MCNTCKWAGGLPNHLRASGGELRGERAALARCLLHALPPACRWTAPVAEPSGRNPVNFSPLSAALLSGIPEIESVIHNYKPIFRASP